MFEGLTHDIRIAIRMVRKNPWLSAIIVLSIAVGIGANLTAFGIADAIFWRTLSVPDADRLVALYNRSDNGAGTFSGVSYPEYEYFRDNTNVLDGLAAYLRVPLVLQISDTPESIIGEIVSSNFFSVIGIPTVLGRGLNPTRDRVAGQPLEMVLSHTLWQRRFSADPNIVGRTVRLNQKTFTVAGVADPEFRGVLLDWQSPPQLWIPITTQDPVFFTNSKTFDLWNFHSMMTVGRVKSTVSVSQASSVLRTLDQRMTIDHPERRAAFNGNYNFTLDVLPLQRARFFPAYREEISYYVQVVGAVMSILLGVAFLNLVNLTIARSETRRSEYAVRLALGASHRRLIRQSIVESLMLTLAGGLASLAVASFFWSALASIDNVASSPRFGRPFRVALPPEFHLDITVLLLATTLAAIAGVVIGAWPIIRARNAKALSALRTQARSGLSSMRWRAGVLVLQVSVSTVLLVSAGLFVRTVLNFERIDNFEARDSIVMASAELPPRRYLEFLEGVRLIPGIERAALKSGLQTRDQVVQNEQHLTSGSSAVSPGYFGMLDISILKGRDFLESDHPGGSPVAIVNETLARQLSLDANPVGQFVKLNSLNAAVEIVGVVKDTNPSPRMPTPNLVYVSIRQFPRASATLLIRPAARFAEVIPMVRNILRKLDPEVPLTNVRTLQEEVDANLSRERLSATLVTVLGVTALILMLVGLYGLVAHTVEARRHEFGIRLAVGANSLSLIRLVLAQSLSFVVAGLLIGTVASIGVFKGISSMLFGVDAGDPISFGVAVTVVMTSAILAITLPSWRTAHLNPAVALRSE